MYVSRVSLVNFRNYASLEVHLPAGLVLLQGENAQGKSNFLEALHYLATSRSPRTGTDVDLIGPYDPDFRVARAGARVVLAGGETSVEITLMGPAETGPVRKQIRVNGVPHRAFDLLGALRMVLFRPEDLDLVNGAPAGRRRALDILLSQIDPAYPRALQRYNRVVLQRNHLLRRIGAGGASQEELSIWDEPLAQHGGFLLEQRCKAVARLGPLSAGQYRSLSDGREAFSCSYVSTIPNVILSEAKNLEGAGREDAFPQALRDSRRRDLALGQTTVGPHRDDLDFQGGERPAASFASRGQQRSAALAWKLAEGEYLRESTGEDPVVLLDAVLSERDEPRRRAVLAAAGAYQQVLLTTTGVELRELTLEPAAWFEVKAGTVSLNRLLKKGP